MDSSDEKSCEGVTHVCDPNVKFGCKDSGKKKDGQEPGLGQHGQEETILRAEEWQGRWHYAMRGGDGDIVRQRAAEKKLVHDAWGSYEGARACTKGPGNQNCHQS